MELDLIFVGTTPLMMHNPRLSDPLDPFTKGLKEYTSKKNKTDDDHYQIADLEFMGGIYHDPEIGPYVPADAIAKTIAEGGKFNKNGKKVKQAVLLKEISIPLAYEGPREIEILRKDPDHRNRLSVGVNGSRTMRTRPIFRNWSVEFAVNLDTALLNQAEFERAASDAGALIGLLDGRAIGYGRFEVKIKRTQGV